MTESVLSAMHAAKVDVAEATARFCGNSSLYEKFLLKFAEDDSFQKIAEAKEAADLEGMLTAAHTLKGVSGNLGMKGLFEACSLMVNRIREGDQEGTAAAYPALEDAYEQVYKAIKYMEEQGG